MATDTVNLSFEHISLCDGIAGLKVARYFFDPH